MSSETANNSPLEGEQGGEDVRAGELDLPLQEQPASRTPPIGLTDAVQSLMFLGAVGAGLGLFGWSMRLGGRFPAYALANSMTVGGRRMGVANVAVGVAIAVALGVVLLVVPRTRATALARRLADRLSPLALLGVLPFVFNARLWAGHELSVMVLMAFGVLALRPLVRRSIEAGPLLPRMAATDRLRGGLRNLIAASPRSLPFFLTLAGVTLYAVYFAFHTTQTHYRFGTSAFDMALEDNLVWNAIHGGPLFKMAPLGGPDAVHAGYHQTYFAYVLGLPYLLAPRPQTLLAAQAILIGAAAIPLHVLAARRLGPWAGCLFAYLYLLNPGVHGSNLYDFHYLPLGLVFVWSAVALLEARRDVWAAITVLFAISVREDVSMLLAVAGLFMIFTGPRPRAGLVLTVVGGVAFGILKFVVMPRYLAGGQSFVHQYQNLAPEGLKSFGGILMTVFANPLYTVSTLLEREKLLYALQIFVPFAFLPLSRGIGVICCLPGFFFTILATAYPPLIQISFQYTAYWTTFLFLASLANLADLRRKEALGVVRPSVRQAWVVALTCGLLLCSYQYGAVLNTKNTRGGFGGYRFGLTADDHARHAQVYGLIAQIPARARVSASELLAPHVSSRPNAYTLRTGVYDAEYILFQLPAGGEEAHFVRDALQSNRFGVIDVRGDYVLARHGGSPARNVEILSRL